MRHSLRLAAPGAVRKSRAARREVIGVTMKLRTRQLALLCLLAAAAPAACASDAPTPDSAETQQSTISLRYRVPVSLSVEDLVVVASNQVSIEDRAELLQGAGHAALANTGTGVTRIGRDARVGTVWSAGQVELRDGAHVFGDVHTTRALQPPSTATVHGTIDIGAGNARSESIELTVPTATGTPVREALEPNVTRDLAAGVYSLISAKRDSVVRLGSGSYHVQELDLQAGSALRVDGRCGPVTLYVSTRVAIKGAVELAGPAERLTIVYTGSQDVFLETAFTGTVIAPNAHVVLASAEHRGSIVGRDVTVRPAAKLQHARALPLVSAACSGEAIAPQEKSDGRVCADEFCCAVGDPGLLLSAKSDGCYPGSANSCVLGAGGNDVLQPSNALTAAIVPVRFSAHGGAGDDVLQGGPAGSVLGGGPGNDTLCAPAEGKNVLNGGDGDDVIIASGNNTVFPGAGRDQVELGDGDDTVMILDLCEIQPGETIAFGGGKNRLVAPVSPSELNGLGISITGEYEFVEQQVSRCASTCSGRPTCGERERCVDEGPEKGMSCLSLVPPDLGPLRERGWPNAPAEVRQLLNEFYDGYTAPLSSGRYLPALEALRANSAAVANAVLTEYQATPKYDYDWRTTQVEILATLDQPALLGHLHDIALEAPAPVPPRHHQPHSAVPPKTKDEFVRSRAAHGIGRLALLRVRGADAALLDIASKTTGQLRERAAISYLVAGRTPERVAALDAVLPASAKYILSLTLDNVNIPTPPQPSLGGQ